jgi:methyl-accepting chemotaxis protein
MNVFARLKIGQRLYLGFAAVLVLLASITTLAWNGLNASQAATEHISERKDRAADAVAWKMGTELNFNRVMAVAKSRNDPAVDAHFKPLIASTTARISEVQEQMEADVSSERGKALLTEIAGKRAAYIAVRKTYFDALKAGDAVSDDQILDQGLITAADAYGNKQQEFLDFERSLVTAADAYGNKQQEFLDFERSLVDAAVKASDTTVKSQIAMVIGLAVAAIALAMVLAWRITRSVTQPLAEAVAISQDIAQGNLTRDIQASRADELGDLLRALSEMKTSLGQSITQVRSATDSINTASSEIASGNQDLSARTEQAASNLEETAASMEQLTSTVRQSADAARQANQLASSASELAVRGGNVVGQVVTTMDEINASSKKIRDIIGVIDGIAFQTNILALNAAVEAARAGEQGRGFAVVASEVRSLAQRSAEAAKEIKGLIGSSVDQVDAGSKLVAEAGQTMSEIVGSVQHVSDIIGEITAAAGEQSDGISQVNVAVNQLDQMTQQNAALVEESAAAAESLKDQAHRLAQVVQVFRISAVSAAPIAVRSLSAPAPRIATQPKKAPVLAATGKPSPVVLKRPSLAGQTTPRPSPAPSSKPVAASGDDGDWESF